MKLQWKTMTAFLMAAVLAFGVGCTKDPENGGNNNGNENGGGSGGGNNGGGGTTEGMYVGIIGFNDALTTKSLSILDNSTEQGFINFIDELSMRDATALYHADNTALDWLQNSTLPSDLINVSLITFTDGLDNASLMLNSNYNSQSEFLNAVNNRIMNDRVQGQRINAYAIGMKGNDVVDEASFRQNLQKLSSSELNVFEVEDMNEATQRFREIASQLYNTTTTVSTNVKIPGGYDNNTVIRITFDNVTNGNNSTQYIQATYSRESGKGKLSNVNYYGLQSSSGATVISDRQDGLCYWYTFAALKTPNGDAVTNLAHMKLWRYVSSTAEWQPESEFVPSSYSDVTVDRKSAVAILVLDCTTSLGSQDFSRMKEAAKEFIRVLNSNTGNGGGGGEVYDDPLSAYNFEWYRQGSNPATGLDEFGLEWDYNSFDGVLLAKIRPKEGATLYEFDHRTWDEVTTEREKYEFFRYASSNSILSEYCVPVSDVISHDEVIGTAYNGNYYLIHITRAEATYEISYTCITITGQAK